MKKGQVTVKVGGKEKKNSSCQESSNAGDPSFNV